MNNFDDVKVFLNYLKEKCPKETATFAETCLDNELYKLITFLEQGHLMPDSDLEIFDIMKNNLKNPHVVMALSQLNTVPYTIQNLIVNALLNDEIADLDGNSYDIIFSNILKNFQLSYSKISQLFEYDYSTCIKEMSEYKPTAKEPTPFSNNTGDIICELCIDKLNTPISPFPSYKDIQVPFACASNFETIDYIIENIPSDSYLAEKIATSLINNILLTDEQKNELFDKYGYDTSTSPINLTPYISNTLYNSAMETIENVSKSDAVYKDASDFLNKAIEYNVLTESAQIDLVNRIIDKTEKTKDYKRNELLSLLTMTTNKPNVLHLIFNKAQSVENRNETLRNPFILKEDLEKQSEIYFNKINSFIKTSPHSRIPYKLENEINYLFECLDFTNNQYEILLEAKMYETLIYNIKTPTRYISQIINNLKKNKVNYAPNLLEKAMLRLKLSKNNCSQQNLDFAFSYIDGAKHCYNSYNTLNSFDSSFFVDDTIFNNKNFCIQLYKAIKYSILKSNNTSIDGDKHTFLLDVKQHIQSYAKNKYEKFSYSELFFAIQDNVNAFRIEIDTNKKGLISLKEHAQKHYEMLTEVSKRINYNKPLAESEISII